MFLAICSNLCMQLKSHICPQTSVIMFAMESHAQAALATQYQEGWAPLFLLLFVLVPFESLVLPKRSLLLGLLLRMWPLPAEMAPLLIRTKQWSEQDREYSTHAVLTGQQDSAFLPASKENVLLQISSDSCRDLGLLPRAVAKKWLQCCISEFLQSVCHAASNSQHHCHKVNLTPATKQPPMLVGLPRSARTSVLRMTIRRAESLFPQQNNSAKQRGCHSFDLQGSHEVRP